MTTATQIPLSVGQEAMWIHWQLMPDHWEHIIPAPFVVDGTLDMVRLRAAVAALGELYPQLRARIASAAGLVLDWSDAPPIELDVTSFAGDRDEAVRQRWQRAFDLRRGPLARVDVLHGPRETIVLISVHHIVFDGASAPVLLDALCRAYAGEPLPAGNDAAALAAHACRSRELADTAAGEPAAAYWRQLLGSPELAFHLPVSVDPPQYTVQSEPLAPQLVADLRACAGKLGVSYVTVLLAGYFALLRRHTGAEDVLVFLPFHGRTSESLREQIGYFANPLPIRCEVRGADSYADLAHRVRGRVKDALRNGELPLPAIMRAAALTGPAARARTHQTVFQHWNGLQREGVDVQRLTLRGPDSTATLHVFHGENTTGFTLAVFVRDDSAGTHIQWKDPSGAVGPTVLAAMVADYREILRALAADPTAALAPVAVVSPQPAALADGDGATPAAAAPAAAGMAAEMVDVWQQVLGIDGIAETDSFFELGGHSLLAERLVLAVSAHFAVDVSIRTLFEHPRLCDFAAQVQNVGHGEERIAVPASSFQQRIWFAEQVGRNRAAYNVPLAWRIRGGGLDAGELARALARLVARHELLRTAFVERDGALWQVIGEPWLPEVERVDAAGDAALHGWLAAASERELDPASGRLLTAALVETGTDQVMFLCLHHLVWDGESAAILLRELDACYRSAGAPAAPRADHAAEPAAADAVERAASAHQERMWFVDRFETGQVYPTAPTYHNLPLFLRIDELPAPDALAAAIAAVAQAHEALRTVLAAVEGRVVQRVQSTAAIAPDWLPASQAASADVPQALLDWAGAPFDLTSAPLVRVAALVAPRGGWLALVGHQAVVDRASLQLIAEQILASVDGRPPVPSSYADWLDTASADAKAAHLEARAARLSPAVDPLRLPERRPREAIHVYEERRIELALPRFAGEVDRLGVGAADLLLAAFAALLGWYTGQQEMVIGVGHDGRRAASQHVVGPLANLLPVRLRPAVTRSFAALAADTATELADARAHDQAPFDELVRRLDPSKDMSRTALFDVLFTFAEPSAGEVQTASGHGKYDLHLVVSPSADGIAGWLVFNGRYFDDDQMQAMAEHYRRLIEQLIAAPDRPIGEADPLTDDERHTQLVLWNATDASYPDAPVHELIRKRAAARPQSVAVTWGDGSLTYRELIERAEAAARALVASGVGPGELVALMFPRGPDQVIAILAVLLAGAAYLPIDPALPADRVQFILADSATRWAVVPDEPPHAGLREFTGRVLHLTDGAAALPRIGLDAPAYCIYTSGTTGRPKGVVITHRNLIRLLHNDRMPFSFAASDVWTMFHSYAFDFSVWELFGALSYGGRVVVVSEQQAKDPELFWALIQRERVTVLNQTPSAFRRLLALEPQAPGSVVLRYVIFGGEALRPAMLAPWLDRYPHIRLINMYGITETTVHASVRTVTRADVDRDASVIGAPIPTTKLLLLDRATERRLLPIGAVGEIFVGGTGVAAGYLNRPELTSERFVASPFAGRLYRSGDLARYSADGALQFVGRADAQVQLRGYRIELGEIESCLREHPAVRDAVAMVDGDRIVAIVQAAAVSLAELRGHLAHKLPEYMIPSVFQRVDELALTANGKLDLAALRARAVALDSGGGAAPRTPTAAAIAGIWCELLGVAAVAADDSFFALGGHSMLAVRLVHQLRRRFCVELPIKAVFEHARLQELADLIDGQTGGLVAPAVPTGNRLPATPFQRRLWLAEALDEQVRNNVPLAWTSAGRLDGALVERAVSQLIADHELLRTAFVAEGDDVWQVIGEPWQPRLERLELRGRDGDGELVRWLDEAAGRRFDLAAGRLMRVALADLGDRHALLLCLHHLVIDGESIPALLGELARYYRAAATGEPAAPPAVQYRELAAQAAGPREVDLAYWQRKLAGAPSSMAFPALAQPGPNGAVRVPLPADALDQLQPLQERRGISWFMAFGTALAVALHRWTGQRTLTIGVPVSIRPGELAGLIGPCLNTVVLRSELASAPLDDAVRAIRDELLAAREHAAVSFDEVVHRLAPDRAPGRVPYVDVTLNMNLRSARRATLGDVELTPLFIDALWSHEAKFGLTLTVAEQDGQLAAMLSYRGDRVAAADAAALAERIAQLIGELAALGRRDDRVQYRALVAAQAALRDTARRASELAYWDAKLAGAPAYLELAAPAEPAPSGAVTTPLRADLVERLQPLQAAYGVTPFMIAAAGLAILLHRWLGQPDIVISSQMSIRDDELGELLGPCLNTIVLRSRLAGDATVLDVVRAMRAEVLGAFDHAGAPFEDVVERLRPQRRAGRTPYGDVSLTFTAAPDQPAALAGHPLWPVEIDRDGAGYIGKLGMTVVLQRSAGQLALAIGYRGDRHRRDDVERIAALLAELLVRIPDILHQPVASLDVAADETAELRRWERGPEPAAMIPIPALVLRRCRERPSAPAVESQRGTLDYQQLVERARSLAVRLQPSLADGAIVALLLDRGEDVVVAMLGSWLAGAAFCPIDPAWPDGRVQLVLDDVGAPVVVTDGAGAARLAGAPVGRPVVRIDEPGDGAAALGEPGWTAASPAYVIYTSGTTGSPKGVVVTHGGLTQTIQWAARAFDVGERDRVSHLLSVAFDATQLEVWLPLTAGACVVPHEAPVVASTVGGWLDDQRISVSAIATPIAEAMWATGAGPQRLRHMLVGGAALSDWPPRGLPYRLTNCYGPTEASVFALAHPLDAPAPPLNRIGRPLAGVRALVLDADDRRCLVGVIGAICLAGSGLAEGYLGQPALTAEKFCQVMLDGELVRIYRTGDLGRWLPDGTLEYVGRADRQLKIRGHRIEPGEIEQLLLQQPEVAQAIVRGDPEQVPALVAYVTPREPGRSDTAGVLARLRASLPSYMVPEALVWLAELPLTTSGKVDIAALPRPSRADLVGGERAAPGNDLERRIAAVWSEVLGIAVGAHDNFFDLGGNSLALARLHSRLVAELDRDIPIVELFEHPTVAAFAAALAGAPDDRPRRAAPARRRGRERSAR